MKKDIQIPEVKDVYVVAVQEFNEEFRTDDWNVYLVNDGQAEIEMILIVSKGSDKKRETSTMRQKMAKLPSKSFAKIEFLQDDVLALDNEFRVSYFLDSKMYDKNFIFKKGTIRKDAEKGLPVIPKKGIIAK